VELDAAGDLVAIRWNGRRELVEVCNHWRVEEAWWRSPIVRDYFKVAGGRWLAAAVLRLEMERRFRDALARLDDAEEGPDALRVFLSPGQAKAFADRAERVVSAGRAPCPLCAEPLDPQGHVCVRLNGYHQRTPVAE